MLSREGNPERIATTLRMPTMGGYVPNMYLTQTTMPITNGNLTQNDNQHVLVRFFFNCDNDLKRTRSNIFVLDHSQYHT